MEMTMMSRPQSDSSSAFTNEFPIGLRVLVVDDDPICLLILDRMLQRCRYKVTTCGSAVEALRVLRENRDGFDVVISDVHMPDMDGFKLLELVGLEMDLPVIMMSANGETSAVMKGIKHGACDYLLKPVRIEELKNIWQHVVRKKKREGGASDNNEDRQLNDGGGGECHSTEGPDTCSSRHSKKRKEDDDDTELDNDDPSTSKKPRVVWSVELHQKFVNAVNQLGVDKAVPKRVLELMDVRGLTRENVASHLQKYRLYLKRISEVPHHCQPGGLSPTMLSSPDGAFGISRTGFSDFSSKSPTITSGSLDRSVLNNSPGLDLYTLRQLAVVRGANSGAICTRPSYGPPLSSSVSSGYHINQGMRQPGSIGYSGNSPSSGPGELHHVPSLSSAGGLDPICNSFEGCLPIENNSNNALVAQILQQQASTSIGLPAAGKGMRPKLQDTYFDVRSEHDQLTLPSISPNGMRGTVADNFRSLDSPYSGGSTSLASDGIVKSSTGLSEVVDVVGSSNSRATGIQSGVNSGALVSNPNASLDNLQGWHSLIQNNVNSGQKSELGPSSQFDPGYGQSFNDACFIGQPSQLTQGLQESGLYNNKSHDQRARDGKHRSKETTKARMGMLEDNTRSPYARQVQAGVSQPEGNFNIGNYALGNNMHVK